MIEYFLSAFRVTHPIFQITLTLFVGSTLLGQVEARRPNILLIMVDQLNAETASAYGNPYLHTPGLDRLINTGSNFMNAYCTQPVCGPSRASMITGSLPSANGSVLNIAPVDRLIPQAWLGDVVKKQGYKTAYFGKWHIHVGKDETQIHGFDVMEIGANGQDQSTLDLSVEYLKQEHTEPFLLVSSFNNPHNICEWARGDTLPDMELEEPPVELAKLPPLPYNHKPIEGEPSFIRDFKAQNPRVFPTNGWDELKWSQYIWAYYRIIEDVDAKIDILLDALEQSEYSDNTVVIFLSDHGDGAGAHEWNQKSVLFQESIKVPFIVRPTRQQGFEKKEINELVSIGIDLLPTIADYANADWQEDERLFGKSVKAIMENEDLEWRDSLVVEMTLGVRDQPYGVNGRALLFGEYKYIHYQHINLDKHYELLFNLSADPGETVNLANLDSHNQVLETCRNELKEWCKTHDDNYIGFLGNL